LFPILIGGVAAISALVLVFKPDPDPEWPDGRTWGNLLVAVIVLAFYSVLMSPLGFILPTAVAASIWDAISILIPFVGH